MGKNFSNKFYCLFLQWKVNSSAHLFFYIKAVTGDVLQEKVFLEISQNSQENTCARVPFLRDSGTSVFLWILRDF